MIKKIKANLCDGHMYSNSEILHSIRRCIASEPRPFELRNIDNALYLDTNVLE